MGRQYAEIRARVNKARQIQLERYKGTDIYCNSQLTPAKLRECCPITDAGVDMLKKALITDDDLIVKETMKKVVSTYHSPEEVNSLGIKITKSEDILVG